MPDRTGRTAPEKPVGVDGKIFTVRGEAMMNAGLKSPHKPKRKFFASLKNTMVGGLSFSLIIAVVVWVLQKVGSMVTKLAQPALAMLPDSLKGGVILSAIETVIMVLVCIYVAGLLARTNFAQRLIQMVHTSVLGSLPQFSFVRGITESIEDSDEEEDQVKVVLVPADVGWTLGFIFEDSGAAIVPVFVPSAPQWATGSVVFAERTKIKPAGISFADVIKIQKRLGAESGEVVRALAAA